MTIALLPSPSSSYFLEGRRGRQLASPSFCFVLLQQEKEKGDGQFVAVTFFSGFFLEGRRGWRLSSPSFLCFVVATRRRRRRQLCYHCLLLWVFFGRQKGMAVVVPFFSLFCCSNKKKKATATLLPLPSLSSFFWKAEEDGSCRPLLFVFVLL